MLMTMPRNRPLYHVFLASFKLKQQHIFILIIFKYTRKGLRLIYKLYRILNPLSMQKAIFTKGFFVVLCLPVFSPIFSYTQCYGPTTTGTTGQGYTKRPSNNSNYFVNHVFSTFTASAGIPASGL